MLCLSLMVVQWGLRWSAALWRVVGCGVRVKVIEAIDGFRQ